MSTLKVNTIRHTGASSDAVTLATDGTCTAKITDNGGNQFANRNKIINGEFRINQRSHSGSAGHNAYTLDRWKYARSANTEFSTSQSTVTPDGFANSVKMTSIGSNGSTGAGDYAYWRYHIEGQDLQDLSKGTSAAKAFTLSFYFKSDVTGTFAISIQDENSRMCNATYTVSNTNWNRYIITIPADTTGTIANSNATGLSIHFYIVAGSNHTSGSAVNTWGSYSASSVATGFNAHITTNSVNLYLTGVQLEVSDYATSFEHLPYGVELARCQRYFFQATEIGSTSDVTNNPICMGTYITSSDVRGVIYFPVEMRAAPTLTSNDNSNSMFILRDGSADWIDELIMYQATTQRCTVRNTADVSGTAGHAGIITQETGDSNLNFKAEL